MLKNNRRPYKHESLRDILEKLGIDPNESFTSSGSTVTKEAVEAIKKGVDALIASKKR